MLKRALRFILSKMLSDAVKKRPPRAGIGRAKGVPNKLTASVKEMIEGALTAVGGKDYLVEQAAKNPVAFMSLAGKLLPRDLNVSTNIDQKLTDALMELARTRGEK